MTKNATTLIRTRADGDLVVLTHARRRVTISPTGLDVATAVGCGGLDGDIEATIARLTALPVRDDDGIAAVRARLLDECLDGADSPAVIAGWHDYVEAIMDAATGPDDRERE